MLKFGILGAAGIAVKFVEAVALVEGVEVVAVASKTPGKAERFAAKTGVLQHYNEYESMLQNAEVDAVYVATTLNFHYENLKVAIRHGKHILCEKNMLATTAETEEIFAMAKAKGLFCMEGMWSRFIPAVQKAKEWIEQGRIGTVQVASYIGGINAPPEHRILRPDLGGGALYDLAVYPIEIITYLVNQPLKGVQSRVVFDETGVDVRDSLILEFETCQAVLQSTCYARIPSPCGVYGPLGYITMEKTHQASACTLYDDQFAQVERFEHPIKNGFEFEIAHMRDCIAEGLLESDVMPHAATLECTRIFDECMAQAGK